MNTQTAMTFAIEAAKDNHLPVSGIYHAADTKNEGADCIVITKGAVVYFDEPDCIVSVSWEAGRFTPAP